MLKQLDSNLALHDPNPAGRGRLWANPISQWLAVISPECGQVWHKIGLAMVTKPDDYGDGRKGSPRMINLAS